MPEDQRHNVKAQGYEAQDVKCEKLREVNIP